MPATSCSKLSEMLTKLNESIFANTMPRLRKLGVSRRLRWTGQHDDEVQIAEIDNLLKALALEDGDSAEIPEADAGVVFIP